MYNVMLDKYIHNKKYDYFFSQELEMRLKLNSNSNNKKAIKTLKVCPSLCNVPLAIPMLLLSFVLCSVYYVPVFFKERFD